MSQGPEDFAAVMTHAVRVLASACGPEDAARAGRFEQAISAWDSEAVQVAQLAKVLCNFTFEEGISVELSETLAPTSNDSLDSGRQDALATDVVRDDVFLSLVKHATTTEAVCWLSHAMRRIATSTDAGTACRREIFATETVRDGFFVQLVQHATTAEAVYSLSRAMCTITTGTDAGAARRSDIFATEAVRNSFFVALAKHATSAEAVYCLSGAMRNITAGTDAGAARRKDIFATEVVRDGFFVPLVKHATTAESCRCLSGAMCNITAGSDASAARRSDIFATEAVRDSLFVALAKHATSAETVYRLSGAMCNITAGTDAGAARRKDIFATDKVRDGFFVPLVKHATSAEACRWLNQACHNVSRPNPSGLFGWFSAPEYRRAITFATPAMRDDFFLPLARSLPFSGAADAEENGKAADLLLTTFSTVARGDGVAPMDLVTPELAVEFVQLMDRFMTELSETAFSVRELLAQVYPLLLHPLCSNALVSKTVIPKDTRLFWDLEEVFKAGINGHNHDYVKSRTDQGLRPVTFILVGATAVSNPLLEKRFDVMKSIMGKSGGRSDRELRERWSFHGTHPKNIDGILTTSLLPFKHPLNPCKKTSDDGFFGANTDGVYVGRYVDYVLKYSNREAPLKLHDEVDVIMFKTLPGKSKHIEKITRDLQPTPGFDSHSSPEHLEWYLFESAQLCPTHVLRVRAVENKRTNADDGLAS